MWRFDVFLICCVMISCFNDSVIDLMWWCVVFFVDCSVDLRCYWFDVPIGCDIHLLLDWLDVLIWCGVIDLICSWFDARLRFDALENCCVMSCYNLMSWFVLFTRWWLAPDAWCVSFLCQVALCGWLDVLEFDHWFAVSWFVVSLVRSAHWSLDLPCGDVLCQWFVVWLIWV